MEADGHELVPLDHHGHALVALVGVGQHGRRGVILGLPRLSLTGVENLEDPGDLLGVCPDDVTLGDPILR